MSPPSMAYVGYCTTCGAMYAAHVISDARAEDLREFVGDLAAEKARIATVPTEEVRNSLAFCGCSSKVSA